MAAVYIIHNFSFTKKIILPVSNHLGKFDSCVLHIIFILSQNITSMIEFFIFAGTSPSKHGTKRLESHQIHKVD